MGPTDRNHWELVNTTLEELRSADPSLRPGYTWAILHAASVALRTGLPRISVAELGVAGGNGLVAMERAAQQIAERLGVAIDVFGFDTGRGLPRPEDPRDAPYLMEEGDFVMDESALRARLSRAELVLGDVADTIPAFLERAPAPIGFCAFDLDLYSSTAAALELFRADPPMLMPRVLAYFDDVHGYPWGRYNGALLAIDEFNQRAEPRRLAKIEGLVHTLPGSQSAERWPDAMYLAHVFDHPTYSAYEGTALVNRLDLHGESS